MFICVSNLIKDCNSNNQCLEVFSSPYSCHFYTLCRLMIFLNYLFRNLQSVGSSLCCCQLQFILVSKSSGDFWSSSFRCMSFHLLELICQLHLHICLSYFLFLCFCFNFFNMIRLSNEVNI